MTKNVVRCHEKGMTAECHGRDSTAAGRPYTGPLIDALRGCRDVKELKALEQRLASTTDAPPLFTWICDLLVARRISRGLAARLLFELHDGGSTRATGYGERRLQTAARALPIRQ